MTISLIVAESRNHVIGREGDMPWRLSTDLKRFKATTLGKPIVMGRKTWNSIGKPLPGRLNIVITRDKAFAAEGAVVVHTLEEGIARARQEDSEEIFIGGGGDIYRQALPMADKLYVTHVETDLTGDTYFPEIDTEHLWNKVHEESVPAGPKDDFATRFVIYQRR